MVKLVMLFKKPADEVAFEDAYSRNLHLLEAMPGISKRQANTVLGGPGGASPYHRILEFYFQDFASLDAALTSEAGVAAGQALMTFAGDVVDLIFVDVFEDDTPPTTSDE